MTQLDIREAGAKLADLIAGARAGEEVIISETGKPDVRLVTVDQNALVFEAFKAGSLSRMISMIRCRRNCWRSS